MTKPEQVQVVYGVSIRGIRAIDWARHARAGEYLITYADSGLSDEEDLGSRCGFDDVELAEIETMLRRRQLTLQANDRGLIAWAVES